MDASRAIGCGREEQARVRGQPRPHQSGYRSCNNSDCRMLSKQNRNGRSAKRCIRSLGGATLAVGVLDGTAMVFTAGGMLIPQLINDEAIHARTVKRHPSEEVFSQLPRAFVAMIKAHGAFRAEVERQAGKQNGDRVAEHWAKERARLYPNLAGDRSEISRVTRRFLDELR